MQNYEQQVNLSPSGFFDRSLEENLRRYGQTEYGSIDNLLTALAHSHSSHFLDTDAEVAQTTVLTYQKLEVLTAVVFLCLLYSTSVHAVRTVQTYLELPEIRSLLTLDVQSDYVEIVSFSVPEDQVGMVYQNASVSYVEDYEVVHRTHTVRLGDSPGATFYRVQHHEGITSIEDDRVIVAVVADGTIPILYDPIRNLSASLFPVDLSRPEENATQGVTEEVLERIGGVPEGSTLYFHNQGSQLYRRLKFTEVNQKVIPGVIIE